MVPDEDSILTEHVVSASLAIFEEHFPGNPILPAFLQLAWVRKCLQQFGKVESFLNVKFLKPILPGNKLQLKIKNMKQKDYSFIILVDNHIATKGQTRLV